MMKSTVSFGIFIALLTQPVPALARDSLGIFQSWGAFRDDKPARCYAISNPTRAYKGSAWRGFASVAHWPSRGIRGQVHIRLSRARAANAGVTLHVGDRQFALFINGVDIWAADKRADAAIIAAMRSAPIMAISSKDSRGQNFTDQYVLRGAATAMDAAALGCARRG